MFFEFVKRLVQHFLVILIKLKGSTNRVIAEEVKRFYVVVMVNIDLGLLLGDMAEVINKFKSGILSAAQFCLVSRIEHFSGNPLYSTKEQFCNSEISHDILIRCSGEEGLKNLVLSVCIDKKKVIRVKRLQWETRPFLL
uniref:Uncharacterized protein n=1 Tax=Nelumbo nucifera TaxID=4432 RepID=A0A822ZVU5_NELNU|nr:TPA_asm: hypothetical protein HUJ06_017588 [Nelumbo nucifera]